MRLRKCLASGLCGYPPKRRKATSICTSKCADWLKIWVLQPKPVKTSETHSGLFTRQRMTCSQMTLPNETMLSRLVSFSKQRKRHSLSGPITWMKSLSMCWTTMPSSSITTGAMASVLETWLQILLRLTRSKSWCNRLLLRNKNNFMPKETRRSGKTQRLPGWLRVTKKNFWKIRRVPRLSLQMINRRSGKYASYTQHCCKHSYQSCRWINCGLCTICGLTLQTWSSLWNTVQSSRVRSGQSTRTI